MYFVDVAMMGDKEFDDNLEHARVAYVAEQARIAAELKAREEENKRLAEGRAELERLQKEQAEAQTKIDAATRLIEADRKALEEEKRKEQERKDREAFEKQAKIKADADAKAAVKQAEADRIAKEKKAAEAKARKAARMPDKKKLIAWVASFNETNVPTPIVESHEAQEILRIAKGELEITLQDAEASAEAL